MDEEEAEGKIGEAEVREPGRRVVGFQIGEGEAEAVAREANKEAREDVPME